MLPKNIYNKKCNKIVLKDGKIIEAGNQEELIMNPKGYYYQINYKQNKTSSFVDFTLAIFEQIIIMEESKQHVNEDIFQKL